MPELRFRVYFNNTSATADDLLHIEEISVEQEEDSAWEARLMMALCLDGNGTWDRQSDIRLRPRTQVRVELQVGTAPFKPLIDGPIVSVDTAMDSRPGRSTATVVVHDNSAWLNVLTVQTADAARLRSAPGDDNKGREAAMAAVETAVVMANL
jgi:hypothetical protein